MLSPHPNHQGHPSVSAQPNICSVWSLWALSSTQKSVSRETDTLLPTGEGINHPEEWGCLFRWDQAYWRECWCIKPSSNLVHRPSRDNGCQSVIESIKRNPSTSSLRGKWLFSTWAERRVKHQQQTSKLFSLSVVHVCVPSEGVVGIIWLTFFFSDEICFIRNIGFTRIENVKGQKTTNPVYTACTILYCLYDTICTTFSACCLKPRLFWIALTAIISCFPWRIVQ